MTSYATNFLRRSLLGRSIGLQGGINTKPELTPGDNIQGHLWAASMQGGGEIHLGPYDFIIQSKAENAADGAKQSYWEIPENVSLIGVPGKTKIYKITYYNEKTTPGIALNLKSLGPVIVLGGNNAGIYNCTVYLDTLSQSSAPSPYINGWAEASDEREEGETTPLGFWVYPSDWAEAGDEVSVTPTMLKAMADLETVVPFYELIYIKNEVNETTSVATEAIRTKIDNCIIGNPDEDAESQLIMGVWVGGNYVDGTGMNGTAMITNNIFKVDCGATPPTKFYLTAGIYITTGSTNNVATGNIAGYHLQGSTQGFADGAFVSVANPTHRNQNAVDVGNVPRVSCTATDNGLRSAV